MRRLMTLILLMMTAFSGLRAQEKADPLVLIYKKIDTTELKMKLYYPADYVAGERYPAIVFFFGGGWKGGNIDQFKKHARHLASKGMIAVTADYRVESRQHTTPVECVKDGRSAIRYLRKHAELLGIDTGRLAAGGGSAGGHVAAATDLTRIDEASDDLSINPRPNALVLFNPVFNNGPGNYGYDRVKEYYRQISPFHNIRKGAAPTIVYLGTQDHLIPVKTAEDYKKKMESVGSRCELMLFEGKEHGFFNFREKGDNKIYDQIQKATDRFLSSLGYIE